MVTKGFHNISEYLLKFLFDAKVLKYPYIWISLSFEKDEDKNHYFLAKHRLFSR